MKSKSDLLKRKPSEGVLWGVLAFFLSLFFTSGLSRWDADYALPWDYGFQRFFFAVSAALSGDNGWSYYGFKAIGLAFLVVVLWRWMDALKFGLRNRRVLMALFLSTPVLWSSQMYLVDVSVFSMAFLGEALLRMTRKPRDWVFGGVFAVLWLSTLGELQAGAQGLTFERLANAVIELSSQWPFFILVLIFGAILFELRRRKTERLFSTFKGWWGVGIWLGIGLLCLFFMPDASPVYAKRFAFLLWIPLWLGFERLMVRIPFELPLERAAFWVVLVLQIGLNFHEVAEERATVGRVRQVVHSAYHAIAERNPSGLLYRAGGFLPYGAWDDAPSVLKSIQPLPPEGQGVPVYPWILSWALETNPNFEFLGVWDGCEGFRLFDLLRPCRGEARLYLTRRLSFIPVALQQAEAARARGDFAAADQAYRGYFADGTLNIGALFQWGLVLYSLQNWNDMEEVYRQIVKLAPSYVQAKYNLGLALKSKGNMQEAFEIFEDLGESGTQDLGTLSHWIEAALAVGEKSSAREAIELLEKSHPQHAELSKWKAAID